MKEITIDATIENLSEVTGFIDSELEACECPIKAQVQIDVAIDEIFSNIAYYAYEKGTVGIASVGIHVSERPKTVTISFKDEGKPYNPLEKDDPDVTKPADEREIGGLGIFIVKKTMDDLRYEYIDGKNVLTFDKIIEV